MWSIRWEVHLPSWLGYIERTAGMVRLAAAYACLVLAADSWFDTAVTHARSFARVITASFSISAHLSTYLACPLWRGSNLAETLGRETILSPSGRPANFSLLIVSIDQVSRGMENTQHVLS